MVRKSSQRQDSSALDKSLVLKDRQVMDSWAVAGVASHGTSVLAHDFKTVISSEKYQLHTCQVSPNQRTLFILYILCVYIYTYTYTYIYIYISVYVYICMYTFAYIQIFHRHIQPHTHTHTRTHTHTLACILHACIRTCVHSYISIYQACITY